MKKLSKRERSLIGICLGVLFFYLFYVYLLEPYVLGSEETAGEVQQQQRLIVKAELAIARKSKYEKRLRDIQKLEENIKKGFLSGKNVHVAAAGLQKVIEDIVKNSGARMISEKVLAVVEFDELSIIPVQVTVRGLVSNIRDMLFEIETNPLHLNIVKIEIRTMSMKRPKDVKAIFTVEGVLNTPQKANNDKKKRKKKKH